MSRSLMVRLGAGTAALAALAAVLVAAPPQSAVADLSSGEAVPAAAVVARRIPYAMFGMHPAQVAGALSPEQLAGVTPASGLGAVTIITNGADWRDIQPTSTLDANFASLDSAIDNARSQGVTQINVVLSGTPCWAAATATRSAEVPRCYASAPKSYTSWRRFVTLTLRHIAARVSSVQVWAEADLPARWAGTPTQLAFMTKIVNDVARTPAVTALNPKLVVASASTTTRLKLTRGNYLDRFWYPYVRALGAYKWPVQAFVGNFYPLSNGSPLNRQAQIAAFKAVLVKARAPRLPVWEGEINYGVPGGGLPYRNLNSTLGAAYVARTYVDNLRFGIARSYWSAWMPQNRGYGITMWPGTIGARAQLTTYGWLAGKWFKGCGTSNLATGRFVTCLVTTTAVATSFTARIVYSEGRTRTYVVPSGVTKVCYASGTCLAVTRGQVIKVGQLPAWLGQ